MVEKSNAGVDIGFSITVQFDFHSDLGFRRFPFDPAGSRHKKISYRSGIIVRVAGVIDQDHPILGNFFLFGNHFPEPFEAGTTLVFDFIQRIVFDAAPIETASSRTAGAALRHLRPLGVQPSVELTPPTSVIDNFGFFARFVHLCLNTLKRL
jgi:hypothetical protein